MNLNPRMPDLPDGDKGDPITLGWQQDFYRRFYAYHRELVDQFNQTRAELVPYTPTWTATSGTAPAIGNGSLDGVIEARGPWLRINIRMLAGTTTTFGSTAGSIWNFSIPSAASRDASGSAYIEQFGNRFFVGSAFVLAASSVVVVVFHNTVNPANFQTPHVWATADRLVIDLEYLTS